ncbi:MAG: PH domain-containing protein [Planctomycetes bacterium]|nr:PH domain-containing protein [Planctomycetota bacterium]
MTDFRDPRDTLAVGAQADVKAALPVETTPVAALAMLDGGEIVELSIKPSLWFVAFAAARVVIVAQVAAAAVAIVAVGGGGWSRTAASLVALFELLALLRGLVASLQWASRLYVLSNRRVMRFSGVLNVSLVECPLVQIAEAHIRLGFWQRVLRLGTIRMTPTNSRLPTVNWEHLAAPAHILEKLVRAIRRAQSGGSPTES